MRQTTPIKRTQPKAVSPKNRIETPLAQADMAQVEYFQKVQETAYQLFVSRGYAHGFDVQDWLAAEQIVRGE